MNAMAGHQPPCLIRAKNGDRKWTSSLHAKQKVLALIDYRSIIIDLIYSHSPNVILSDEFDTNSRPFHRR